MQRAIPPDLTRGASTPSESTRQHEAIGDLHLAADNFSGAIEEYGAALRDVGPEAPAERVRLLERIAEALIHRGESEAAHPPPHNSGRRSRPASADLPGTRGSSRRRRTRHGTGRTSSGSRAHERDEQVSPTLPPTHVAQATRWRQADTPFVQNARDRPVSSGSLGRLGEGL